MSIEPEDRDNGKLKIKDLPGSKSKINDMACGTLVDMALERDARDNITAVVVRAEDLSSPDRTELRAAP